MDFSDSLYYITIGKAIQQEDGLTNELDTICGFSPEFHAIYRRNGSRILRIAADSVTIGWAF
ncbi:MAG: hypothetical protein CMF59_00725 [Leptospiraceae bacterium]|nr:hypothetical protein [Leptospiraceae bacterium]